MGFTEAIQTCFSKYATFSGRARRSEYWYFFLCYAILSGVLSFLARNSTVFTYVSGIVEIALFIPMLAVSVRRLHDIGKSGWFYRIYHHDRMVRPGQRSGTEYVRPEPEGNRKRRRNVLLIRTFCFCRIFDEGYFTVT